MISVSGDVLPSKKGVRKEYSYIFHTDKESVIEHLLPTDNKHSSKPKNEKKYLKGLSFGTRVRNLSNNKIGYVVGGNEKLVLIAFEDGLEPQNIAEQNNENRKLYKSCFWLNNTSLLISSLTAVPGLGEQLQYIAAPYATFTPFDPDDPMVWQVGASSSYRFRMWGFIPLGVHTINIERFDIDGIQSREGNDFVPVWNHKIYLKDLGSRTEYTDEVDIDAGWKTIFVWLWAKAFYSHRQHKWLKLLLLDDK